MKLTALIMAGGKASRMRAKIEKPLVEVNGLSMLERVVGALQSSPRVHEIVVAVTSFTPATAKKAREMGLRVAETPGLGFEADMKFAVKTLALGDVLIVSADLPFLSSSLVDAAVERYVSCGKPALSVMAPVEVYRKLQLKPSFIFEINNKQLVPIGLNIINGRMIDEPKLDEEVLLVDSADEVVNINTPEELEVAQSMRGRAAKGG